MKVSSLYILIMVLPMVGMAQLKEQPQPKFDFQKEYSFQLDQGLELDLPPIIKAPKGILEDNPFAKDQVTIQLPMTKQMIMPILHPELEGFGMPILKPAADVDYSLLIQDLKLEE